MTEQIKRIRFNVTEINPEKINETPQGGIKVEGVVIRTGVFQYGTIDGEIVNEFLPREELFKDEAMNSLMGAPVTNEHPSEMINPSNYRGNAIGFVTNIRNEKDRFLVADLIINDGETINEIVSGKKKELSAGYYVDSDRTAGVSPEGEEFDVIQRNIIFNHCSVVQMGRCGSDVSLRLNSAGHQIESPKNNESGSAGNPLFNGKSAERIIGKNLQMTKKNKVEKQNDERMNVIREEDGQFCVYSEDGERSFGCYDSREKAEERLAEIHAFKENSATVEKLNSLLSELELDFESFLNGVTQNKEQILNVLSGNDSADEQGDKKENGKSFDEKVKAEALARLNLLIAARELNVPELTGMEDKEELQLLIVQTTKPHMDIEGKSSDYLQALLEDSLSGVDLNSFWNKAASIKEEEKEATEDDALPVELLGEESEVEPKESTLNSILSTVRGTKSVKKEEPEESTEDLAKRLVYLKSNKLF